jgi:hypothetical protein
VQGEARVSGQSAAIGGALAGDKCNAKNHERPFVIEWDATDTSGFEARVAQGLVFVKYEGCDLKVLDACGEESAEAYKTPEWTSGSVEKLDVATEAELFAKLPLSAATLGARVGGGEKFHMEYYVAGTRTAKTASVKKSTLKGKACKDATHFVYGYNLGAFALGTLKSSSGEVGVSVQGVGAGANQKFTSNAEKKGGVLASCSPEKTEGVKGCQTPIRLMLRELGD